MKIDNFIKKNIIFLILLIFFSIHFKFFENIYVITRSNYEERLVFNYGFCEKSSYGFVKYLQKKYKFKKNINIINDEVFPSSDSFIYKPKKKYLKNKIILLNYNEIKSKINMNDYLIIEKYKNCFLLKKND